MQHRDIIVAAHELGQRLLAQKRCVSTVESCTGGGISYTITSLDGSSAWFDRGFVTYSNAAKTEQVGVPATLITTHGAVSEAVALAMAQGGIIHSAADYSVAVTGVAGPAGGSAEKPVGMVCIACASKQLKGAPVARVETHFFTGDRHSVRKQTIFHALEQLSTLLDESP